MSGPPSISVNTRAQVLIDRLKTRAAELKVAVAHGARGETLIDAGSRVPGSRIAAEQPLCSVFARAATAAAARELVEQRGAQIHTLLREVAA
jgi:methenyltetrahydromethanopterin cyclohydrolase